MLPRDVSWRKAVEGELARLEAEPAEAADTDALTGPANRRAFDAALGREWERTSADQLPLSLMLTDVDRFDAYDDASDALRPAA